MLIDMPQLYYAMILQKYIIKLEHGIIPRNYVTDLDYRIILWSHMTDAHYGIVSFGDNVTETKPLGPWDLPGTAQNALGTPQGCAED